MFRVEFDQETGESKEIDQIAYRSTIDHSKILVLDATDPAPEGMEAFDPQEDAYFEEYQSALAELNEAYQIDVIDMTKAFSTAYLADGSSQVTKQDAIRAQYVARKSQYMTDLAALKTEYGV